MKNLHKPHMHCWSSFDAERNVDFNSYFWVRDGGNVVVDPMPMSDHDLAQVEQLGGAEWIVITNSDHVRDAAALASRLDAKLAGPAAERGALDLPVTRWLSEGDELVGGMQVYELHGSKTPGELALLLEGDTLITGDLVRAHRGGSLMMLPDPKLSDRGKACDSVSRLSKIESIEAVLVGDGWPVFRHGHALLLALARSL
jgi:glyoxylase-like metal-dependent hydrolase (beta-lactamase superfamily II)